MVLNTGGQILRSLLSVDTLAVPKAGSSRIHHRDLCREVTLSSALAATALAGDIEKAP